MKSRRKAKTVRRRRILFAYDDDQAHDVAVTGDFNAWDTASHPMKRNGEGQWQKIMMLPPGEYAYKFIVDGQFSMDPRNPDQRPNDFGTFNNILRVRAARK